MKRLFVAGLIACLSVAASAVAAPLEAYGRLPAIEDVQISPDGQMLASSVTIGGEQRYIMVKRIADNATVYSVAAGNVKLRDLSWAGPDHLVVTSSRTSSARGVTGGRREYFLALLLDIKSRKSKHLLSNEPNAMNVVARPPEVRMVNGSPSLLLYGFRMSTERGSSSNRLYLTVFRHNVGNGSTMVLAQGEEDVDDWQIAPDGTVLARSLYDQGTGQWSLQMRDGSNWKTVEQERLPLGSPRIRGLGRTADSVVTLSPAEAGEGDDDEDAALRRTMREYRLSGTWNLPPTTGQLLHDPATGHLIGGGEITGDTSRYSFFDPKADAAWKAIIRTYPGQMVTLASWSANRRRIVVKVDDPKAGPAFAFVDLDARRADWIGNVYNLDPEDISEKRAIIYKAKDGLDIPGYLTLPRGKDAKKLPLVVLPHGGPAARDTLSFDWWSQAMASRGYAVLQPNFRGSAAVRAGLREAGFGEWGRKMQSDISDGVAHLAREGLIDPKRVCIVGGSYGGYAALAGVTVEQGVYRCAVSVNGVTDLRRMLLTAQNGPIRRNSTLRYWSAFMGVDGARDPDLASISPAILAARADAPVLMIHGKDDTVVPYDQSRVMADALKKAGKPHEFVTLAGEDHWLSRGETRLQMLQATVAFLERENPPR